MTEEVILRSHDDFDPSHYELRSRVGTKNSWEDLVARFRDVLPSMPEMAEGIVWSEQDFCNERWVAEYIQEGRAGASFRDVIVARYGPRIRAAYVSLDYGAERFDEVVLPIITANSDMGCVIRAHVCEYVGTPDVREALHAMFHEDLLYPLVGAEILAPNLVLSPVHPNLVLTRVQ